MHGDGSFHPRHRLPGKLLDLLPIPHRTDHRAELANGDVRLASDALEAPDDAGYVCLGGVLAHDDDHGAHCASRPIMPGGGR